MPARRRARLRPHPPRDDAARGAPPADPSPARPHIEVGAGIVWRRGKVLMCLRPAGKMLAGLWEFPGGKRDPGETIQECIRRELKEECDLDVSVGEHLVDVTHTYSHIVVTLRVYHCRCPRGRVRRLACDGARWVRVGDIPSLPLPAADLKILEALGIDRDTALRATSSETET
jgi:A/G-specific adenine glycosylase